MKIIINYDLLERIKDVKEDFGLLKIIRNNKYQWAKFNLPLYTLIDLLVNPSIYSCLSILILQFSLLISADFVDYKITNQDIYDFQARQDLLDLLYQLRDLYIKTDMNLLLEAALYDKKYEFFFNENKIPSFMEKKYILVPTYNMNNDIKDISLLQEHIIGSKVYVLSLGYPNEEYKVVPSIN